MGEFEAVLSSLYDNELFTEERGVVVAYIPVAPIFQTADQKS